MSNPFKHLSGFRGYLWGIWRHFERFLGGKYEEKQGENNLINRLTTFYKPFKNSSKACNPTFKLVNKLDVFTNLIGFS